MNLLRLAILVPLFLIQKPCFSQNINGSATYGITTSINFDKIDELDEKDVIVLQEIIDDSNKQSETKFKLDFDSRKSNFYAVKNLRIGNAKVDMVSIQAKITGIIYTNLDDRIIIQQKETLGEKFRIIKKIDDYKWKLVNEQLKIGEFTCHKAILEDSTKKINKVTEAWYTNEIPLNTGPMGFCGLPGLIVILKDDIFIYKLEEIKFNEKKGKEILKPKKGREVTVMQYDSIYDVLIEKKEQLEKEAEGY